MSRTPRTTSGEQHTEARIQKITGILIGAGVTALIAVLLTANAQRATRAAMIEPPPPAATATEQPEPEPEYDDPYVDASPHTTPPPAKPTTRTSPAATPQTRPSNRPAAASAACTYSTDRTTVLSQGSTGPAVRQAQCLLNTLLGHHLALDADFGPATGQAVRQLQHCAHLTTDGKIGPATWKALTNPPATCHTN